MEGTVVSGSDGGTSSEQQERGLRQQDEIISSEAIFLVDVMTERKFRPS